MAQSRVRAPDGQILTVDHPSGSTPEQIKDLAKKQHATPPPRIVRREAPPPAGPDIVGRAKQSLVAEPPAGDRTAVSRGIFGENIGSWDAPGRYVRAAGDLFLPGSVPEAAGLSATLPVGGGLLTAPLKRTAARSFASGVTSAAQTGDWREGLKEAGSEGLSQVAGEVLPGVVRFGQTQRAGQPFLARRAAEEAAYPEQVAARRLEEAGRVREARATHQEQKAEAKRSHAEREAAKQTQYEAQARDYAQHGAQSIADAFKQQVPAFNEFPSTEAGLVDMVYGKGQQRLSERFDAALNEVVRQGSGKKVPLSQADADALGLRLSGLRQLDKTRPPIGDVDGGQLAERLTGFWKKDHGVYRRGVTALDKADLGNQAARAEYRAAQALIDFADKSQMLKGEKFNPESARAAFTNLKKIDALRRRGQGDVFRGPIAEAVRRPGPVPPVSEPPPITQAFRRPAPLPDVPKPAPLPKGVEATTIPKLSPYGGAIVGEVPALVASLLAGHVDYSGAAIGGAAGALSAMALSGRPIVTKAPLSPAYRFATSAPVTGLGAQEARRLMDQP